MSLRRRLERLEKAAEAAREADREELARIFARICLALFLDAELDRCLVEGGEPDLDGARAEYAAVLERWRVPYDPERDEPLVLEAVEDAAKTLATLRRQ